MNLLSYVFDWYEAGFWGIFNPIVSHFYEFFYSLGMLLRAPYNQVFTYSGTAVNPFLTGSNNTFTYGFGLITDYLKGLDVGIVGNWFIDALVGVIDFGEFIIQWFGDIVINSFGLKRNPEIWEVLIVGLPAVAVVCLALYIVQALIKSNFK